MNRLKFFAKVLTILILILIIIVSIILTGYFLYNGNTGIAGVFITIVGILVPVLFPLVNHIFVTKNKNLLIERKLFDEHFVDRELEYIKLTRFIKEQEERIISISRKYGMGKSLFSKMFCDKVNYTDVKKWKGYS